MKQTGEVWTAHEPVVSCVTWGSGDTIASGGEDGKYKIWDLFGRLLFQSADHQFPITSISFSPNADSLLVGTFGIVKFCDPSGKSISSVQQTNLGSPFRFCWSQDNLIAATGTGSGKLLRLDIAGVKVEDDTHQLEQMNSKAIKVTEIDSATTDMIETTERITSISTGYKNIVIGTTEQLQIFVKGRLNTPQLVELKEHTPNLIKQTDQLFAVVSTTAIIILTYEGRIQSENRFNFSLTAMNLAQVALNSRFCVIVDPRDARNLIGFENMTGKAINGSVKSLESSPLLTHKDNIRHVELQADQQLLSFVDEQKDLYIMKLGTPKLVPHRIMSNVTAIMTSSTLPVLSFLKGSQVEALINPAIAFVDNALVAQSTVSIEATNLGRNPRLFAFNEGTVSLRNHDGSVIRGSLNPLATLLIKAVKDRKLSEGLSICRFAADKSLWMTLSGFALEHNQTEVLAECYKALGKVDRVRQINRANETSDKTLQVIELKALGNEPETMDVLAKRSELTDTLPLLFAKCAWKEALDLAIKKGSHIDTVLYFRSHYLKSNEKEEDIEKFREMNQKIDVSWEDIKAKYPMTA
ncbi:Oidioi.mRNA.OKI2018_I69.chr1.g2388.t1.cds [Oikopleura dioica]|uniref:Oidioi.mRNA.OKI2018_I69.chr1.g2388.t1.cds n=1 Tax=Oikopleura dioica TaxID=34765 RepID=A0ABN7SQZ7_OIKDI|nr:Oidioi.mRNA.OKI2018_I69.chr1.g2388.t1.cds [Oikopleura dioica]